MSDFGDKLRSAIEDQRRRDEQKAANEKARLRSHEELEEQSQKLLPRVVAIVTSLLIEASNTLQTDTMLEEKEGGTSKWPEFTLKWMIESHRDNFEYSTLGKVRESGKLIKTRIAYTDRKEGSYTWYTWKQITITFSLLSYSGGGVNVRVDYRPDISVRLDMDDSSIRSLISDELLEAILRGSEHNDKDQQKRRAKMVAEGSDPLRDRYDRQQSYEQYLRDKHVGY